MDRRIIAKPRRLHTWGKLSANKLLSPLQESLHILNFTANQIIWAISPLDKGRGTSEELKFVLSQYVVILLTMFLKEWEILGRQGRDDPRLRNTLRITSPAIDRIRSWKGLRKYCNIAAAHGQRDDQGKFIHLPEALDRYKVPSNYAETILLGKCAIKAITELTNEFSEEMEASKPRLKATFPIPIRRGMRIYSEIGPELAEVQRQMELERSRIKKKGAK